MNSMEHNRQVYNQIADHFSQTRALLWDDLKDLKHYAFPGARILDIGCGNGRLYQMFDDLSIAYTGIDQSENLIAHAKKKFPQAQFEVGNMIALPFPDHSFDRIYAIASFHHLPTEDLRVQALQEMKRVLVPGGKIIMTNWNAQSNWAQKKIEKGDWQIGEQGSDHLLVPWKNSKAEVQGVREYWLLTPEGLEQLAVSVGLIVEKQYFVSRGEEVPLHRGMNIVSIFTCP